MKPLGREPLLQNWHLQQNSPQNNQCLELFETAQTIKRKQKPLQKSTNQGAFLGDTLRQGISFPAAKQAPFPKHFNPEFSLNQKRKSFIKTIWSLVQTSQCSLSTYYSTIALLDLFLSTFALNSRTADILPLVLLNISAKLTETRFRYEILRQIISEVSSGFSVPQLLKAEMDVLETLQNQLSLQTAFHRVTHMLADCPLHLTDLPEQQQRETPVAQVQRSFGKMVFFFVELSAKHYCFNQFDSEVIALSSLLCSRVCVGVKPFSSQILAMTRGKLQSALECVRTLFLFLRKTQPGVFERFKAPLLNLTSDLEDRLTLADVYLSDDEFASHPYPKCDDKNEAHCNLLGKRESGGWPPSEAVSHEGDQGQFKLALTFSQYNEEDFQKKLLSFSEYEESRTEVRGGTDGHEESLDQM